MRLSRRICRRSAAAFAWRSNLRRVSVPGSRPGRSTQAFASTLTHGPFRIGNAAGEAHPIIGEGMSMALQAARLLTHYLVARGKPNGAAMAQQRDVARQYETQWRRQFEPRLLFAAGFAHMAMRPRTTVPLIVLAQAWPGMLTLGARIKTPMRQAPRT